MVATTVKKFYRRGPTSKFDPAKCLKGHNFYPSLIFVVKALVYLPGAAYIVPVPVDPRHSYKYYTMVIGIYDG